MALYEVIREIPNRCANNRMRDVAIEEAETDDPCAWVRARLDGPSEVTSAPCEDGVIVEARSGTIVQRFIFTRI